MESTNDDRGAIRLDQFLKLHGIAATGGHAKLLIQNEQVCVNGELETRRRRKLQPGDVVTVEGQDVLVEPNQLG